VSAPKYLGANFQHFWVQIGPKLLINAGTLAQTVAKWPPKADGILSSALGPIQGHKVQHLLVLEAD